MRIDLSGQRAVVFGAARGIGQAIASAYADAGCSVLGVDADWHDVSPGSIEWMKGDVVRRHDVEAAADRIAPVDHVVFAVGVGSGLPASPFWNQSEQSWEGILQVNLLGAVTVANVLAPRLADRRKGTLTFLVSVAGQIGSPTDPPYSAAKAGLINFMQVAARDLAPFGVRSNAISPGMVKTQLNRSVWEAIQRDIPEDAKQPYDDWALEKIRRVSPLGRWQTPEDIAALAIFLASDHARDITGQTLNVDGGQVMHS